MATNFESIYEKFLMQVDDYELGIIKDYELSNICFSYLDKARALYFPQCDKDLTDVTVSEVTYVNGVRNEQAVQIVAGDDVFIVNEGYFNFDLTSNEQYILALGMKKAWLSSKTYSADLMSKDIGDRDYKATQGFNYIKELRALDSLLEEEIRKNAVQYTYNIDDLTSGW